MSFLSCTILVQNFVQIWNFSSTFYLADEGDRNLLIPKADYKDMHEKIKCAVMFA